jgi:integrase/recombinase XerD
MATLPAIQNQVTTTAPRDYIQRFLESRDITEVSARSYRVKLEAYFKWLEERGVSSPSSDNIVEYVKFMKAGQWTSASISSYITPLRLFYAWLSRRFNVDDITNDDRIKIKTTTKGHRKQALTEEQAVKVVQGVDRTTNTGKRDYALLVLLFNTGLRSIEITRASVGDIQHDELRVHGKGRTEKDDFVILNTTAQAALNDYLKSRGSLTSESPLFESESNRGKGAPLSSRAVQHLVSSYFTKAGVKSSLITPHSTRHTFASVALQHGTDVMQVKESLRHSSVQTTMRYTHMLKRRENAAEKSVSIG